MSGLNKLLDDVDWRCTVCGAKAGACSCWKKCWCGWSYLTGSFCANNHDEHLADTIRCICSRQFATGRDCADARGNKSRCACVCHRKGVRAAYEKKVVDVAETVGMLILVRSRLHPQTTALCTQCATSGYARLSVENPAKERDV